MIHELQVEFVEFREIKIVGGSNPRKSWQLYLYTRTKGRQKDGTNTILIDGWGDKFPHAVPDIPWRNETEQGLRNAYAAWVMEAYK